METFLLFASLITQFLDIITLLSSEQRQHIILGSAAQLAIGLSGELSYLMLYSGYRLCLRSLARRLQTDRLIKNVLCKVVAIQDSGVYQGQAKS